MEKQKIKLANHEQEYAHIYPTEQKTEDYRYPNEDQRIKFHVDSDTDDNKTREELYNVEPEQTVGLGTNVKAVNKIKARIIASDALTENNERAYKVRNTSPIWDKSDPGQEAYKLPVDPRDAEVEQIKQRSADFEKIIDDESKIDRTTPHGRFSVGSIVKHKEEGIKGEIKFVGSEKIAIIWEDKTRERFSLAEASKSLEIEQKVEYVDDIQTLVDPIHTTPQPKSDLGDDIDDIYNKALASLNNEDDDEIEDGTPNQINTSIEKIKKKAAFEIVDLMQSKGLLPKNKEAADIQVASIMKMNDSEFDALKHKIVKNQFDAADMALLALNEDDDFDDIEDGAEMARQREAAKKASKPTRTVDGIEMGDISMFENGGLSNFRGTIGDFSSAGGASSYAKAETETRAIKRYDSARNVTASPQLDFSGFKNLEGLKAPLNIPSKDVTVGSKFSDLFSTMNWTTVTKVH